MQATNSSEFTFPGMLQIKFYKLTGPTNDLD